MQPSELIISYSIHTCMKSIQFIQCPHVQYINTVYSFSASMQYIHAVCPHSIPLQHAHCVYAVIAVYTESIHLHGRPIVVCMSHSHEF